MRSCWLPAIRATFSQFEIKTAIEGAAASHYAIKTDTHRREHDPAGMDMDGSILSQETLCPSGFIFDETFYFTCTKLVRIFPPGDAGQARGRGIKLKPASEWLCTAVATRPGFAPPRFERQEWTRIVVIKREFGAASPFVPHWMASDAGISRRASGNSDCARRKALSATARAFRMTRWSRLPALEQLDLACRNRGASDRGYHILRSGECQETDIAGI